MAKRVTKQSKAPKPSATGNCGCGCLPASKE